MIRTPEPCHNFTIGGEDLSTIFFACRTTIYRMGIKCAGDCRLRVGVWAGTRDEPCRVRAQK